MEKFLNDIALESREYYEWLVQLTPRVMIALPVMVISWLLARQIRRFSDGKLKRQMEDPLLAEFLAAMIRVIVITAGLLLSFKLLGMSGVVASILAGAGISAFIIGFALRDIGENFLAGILMAFKRPFRVGDFVETGPIRGKVVALSIRDTQLKTPDGKDVYIPNATIIKNPLINYTIDGFLRFDFALTLPGGSDYTVMAGTIERAVSGVNGVLKKQRRPSVNLSDIAAGKLEVTVSYWVNTFTVKWSAEKIKSDVLLAVHDILEGSEPKT